MVEVLQSILNCPRETASTVSGSFNVRSPLQPEILLARGDYCYSDIELAVASAWNGFERKLGLAPLELQRTLSQLSSVLEKNREKIFEIAQFELGRTRDDLDQEWRQTKKYLDALQAWMLSTRDLNFLPRGVVAVLGSSVWPIFYSLQFCLANLCAGNAVILKPSEKASLTVSKLIQILRSELLSFEAVQVLIGEREVGRRLACHEQVSVVIFQGTFEMGMRVRQDTSSQPGKEVLLYLGAKNFSVVYEDSSDQVARVLSQDCFQGAGQDCQSISLIWVARPKLESFTKQFSELAKNFEAGPLIDSSLVDRYLKYIAISEREGAQIVMRGKSLKGEQTGNFVLPTIAQFQQLRPEELRKSVSLQTEILSPMVSILGFDQDEELEKCLAMLNHGKLASVWSHDPQRIARLRSQMTAGLIVSNQSVLDTDPWQTHQARRRSGNHARLGKGLIDQLTYPLA